MSASSGKRRKQTENSLTFINNKQKYRHAAEYEGVDNVPPCKQDYPKATGKNIIRLKTEALPGHGVRAAGAPAEAFIVNTAKICFVAVMHADQNRTYRGDGYTTFEDGNTLYFKIEADSPSDVREKCLMVARRIANVYGGTLQRGTLTVRQESSETLTDFV